jgi:4a-hydroxytetrahydrobiopterin dehydratase
MFLYEQHCKANVTPTLLTEEQLATLLKEIPDWKIHENNHKIFREFKFKDYRQTILFINTLTRIIEHENHHPEIRFGYNYCSIHFSTHSAKGITIFDLICAAQIDQLHSKQEFNA